MICSKDSPDIIISYHRFYFFICRTFPMSVQLSSSLELRRKGFYNTIYCYRYPLICSTIMRVYCTRRRKKRKAEKLKIIMIERKSYRSPEKRYNHNARHKVQPSSTRCFTIYGCVFKYN
jgi:hypothetical protein